MFYNVSANRGQPLYTYFKRGSLGGGGVIVSGGSILRPKEALTRLKKQDPLTDRHPTPKLVCQKRF